MTASHQASLFHSNAPILAPGERFSLHQGDAVEWLRFLPSESVDLAISDPAYESLEKHRKIGTTTRLKNSKASSNEWFPIFHNDRFPDLFTQVYRVLKPDTHFYMLCDQETMFVAKPLGEAAGFKFWKGLVWKKDRIGMGYHFRAKFEHILFFEKGKRRLNDLGISDVLEFPRVVNGYPTEKPVELIEVLVNQSSSPGEIVIDPFMGSGSTGEATLRLGRRFAGSDLLERSVALTRERLLTV